MSKPKKPSAKGNGNNTAVPPKQPTVNQNFFLKEDQMVAAERILPGSLERTMIMFERQQVHDQNMDRDILEITKTDQELQAQQLKFNSSFRYAELWCGVVVILLFGSAMFYLVSIDKTTGAMVLGGIITALAGLAKVLKSK